MLLIQLFNGMQSTLSMVYDREMGNMRTLLDAADPSLQIACASGVETTRAPGKVAGVGARRFSRR